MGTFFLGFCLIVFIGVSSVCVFSSYYQKKRQKTKKGGPFGLGPSSLSIISLLLSFPSLFASGVGERDRVFREVVLDRGVGDLEKFLFFCF